MARKTTMFRSKKKAYNAELWAISEALEVASKGARNTITKLVKVFTDSKAALTIIQEKNARSAVKEFIYQRAKELTQSGHEVIFRWVPVHSKIEGTEKADLAQKMQPIEEEKS